VEGKRAVEPDSSVVARFERRELSRRLAEELEATVCDRAISEVEREPSRRATCGPPGKIAHADSMLAASARE
jgi:hypothetical protein